MHKLEHIDIGQIPQDLQQYPNWKCWAHEAPCKKRVFSSLVGSYQEELLSGRIIVRGKKKMAKGHKRKWRFPLLRKQETKTSCWTRNITTSVSLKTWQKLYILSCVGHCVNKNKQRKELPTCFSWSELSWMGTLTSKWDAPPVFYLL